MAGFEGGAGFEVGVGEAIQGQDSVWSVRRKGNCHTQRLLPLPIRPLIQRKALRVFS